MNTVYLRRAVALFALCLFTILLIAISNGSAAAFDDPIRYFFYSLRCDALTAVVLVITNAADKLVIIGICLVLLAVPRTRLTFGIPLSAGALGTIIINSIVKILVKRPRPDIVHLISETGYSFPSGHSISSMFFYGAAIWLTHRYVSNKKARVPIMVILAIPMLLVGPTRIYLGVHYPTDVLGGWCLGFAAIVLLIEIVDRLTSGRDPRLPSDRDSGR